MAEILQIVRKRRWEPLAPPRLSDFRCGPGAPVDPGVVVEDPRVSLYSVDPKGGRAIFVETPRDVDLAAAPFMYQAQFQHATRLIAVPYEEFHALADSLGDPFQRLVLIYSVGRCGSTLVSRMFGRVSRCLSLSEPDVYTRILLHPYPAVEAMRLVRSVTRVLYHPMRPGTTHLVLKFRGLCCAQGALMHEAFPEATLLFMYRSAEAVVTSSMRVYPRVLNPFWTADVLSHSWASRLIWRYLIALRMPTIRRCLPLTEQMDADELSRLGGVGVATLLWLGLMDQYLRLHEAGLPLVAFRYEDLVARPEAIMGQLFARCGLPAEDVPAALNALANDSQEESLLGRRHRRDWTLQDRHRRKIERVLERHPVIRRGEFLLPDTIA